MFGLPLASTAHILGALGEICNFVGAVVLAYDLLGRPREEKLLKDLQTTQEIANVTGLKETTYRSVNVADPGFVERFMRLRASRLGWTGVGILVLGFALLIFYHILEFVESL